MFFPKTFKSVNVSLSQLDQHEGSEYGVQSNTEYKN